MTKNIYGIDPHKKFTGKDVRNAIIKCFKEAHTDNLDELKEYGNFKTKKEFEEVKNIEIEVLVKRFMKEAGGNFDNPSKKDLSKLCDKLAEFATNFRSTDIIDKNYKKIMKLVKKLD